MKKEKKAKQARHKCSICGRVRNEKYMRVLERMSKHPIKTRYGNNCWCCVDNPDCLQKAQYFQTY